MKKNDVYVLAILALEKELQHYERHLNEELEQQNDKGYIDYYTGEIESRKTAIKYLKNN